MGILERLLLSAVMEGDRRDTAEFMQNKCYPDDIQDNLWHSSIAYMERKLDALDKTSPINKARREISDRCAAFAEKPGGIIQLNVPTGAGKTLASLRYALRHAEKYRKKRIVFTSSLLSVLDQNAKVIRDYLPEQEMILEHHSNVVQPEQVDEREEWEMMVEAWRAPVIITTLVQLLNTMFLGRSGNIRRFHALCNAVLVIDEIQTVPNKDVYKRQEDHYRLQYLKSGFSPEEAYQVCKEMEHMLGQKAEYAFDSKLGYLTACPTNVLSLIHILLMENGMVLKKGFFED